MHSSARSIKHASFVIERRLDFNPELVYRALRTANLADVPTISDTGVPGYEAIHYTSMLVKTGTPADILSKLSVPNRTAAAS